MYRTGDPRFRRRLDELGQTLESAQEATSTTLYDFQQLYIKPCLASISECFTSVIEAGCPTLNLTANQRERHRRLRESGRRRGARAELSFDFYDDWDDEESDALMGWGNDEFERLVGGGEGYGTIGGGAAAQTAAQPGRRRGMSYPKARRKSAVDVGPDPTVIPGSSLFGKLFGGKALRYKPSAAGLQENPGVRVPETEGEDGRKKRHRRHRSQTATSAHTTDSLSSRGDIFPSDEEDDAIPLDDEFAMVLERRTTLSGLETESSSGRTRSQKRGKRPSAGSRISTHSSARKSRSSTNSSAGPTPTDDVAPDPERDIPAMNELKQEERALAEEEEAEVERKRHEAQMLAAERGLVEMDDDASKEDAPQVQRTPVLQPVQRFDEPSAMTTPLATTDDEAETKGVVDEVDDDDDDHDEGVDVAKRP